MLIDDRSRTDLHNALANALGSDQADTLMTLLPPVGWSDLVTHRDLAAATAGTHAEIADLRTELKTEMAGLRTELKTEMAELRTELKTEMAELRTDVRTEIAGLRSDLTRELSASVRTMLLANMGSVLSAVSLAFVAARFA